MDHECQEKHQTDTSADDLFFISTSRPLFYCKSLFDLLCSLTSIFFLLSGPECSVPLPANSSFWNREDYPEGGLARASHKAVVEQGLMWVIGGYVFNASDYQMVKA